MWEKEIIIPKQFKLILPELSPLLNDNFIWFVSARKGPQILHLVEIINDIHYLLCAIHCASCCTHAVPTIS